MQLKEEVKSTQHVALKDGTYDGFWFRNDVIIDDITIPVNAMRTRNTPVRLHVVNGKALVEVK